MPAVLVRTSLSVLAQGRRTFTRVAGAVFGRFGPGTSDLAVAAGTAPDRDHSDLTSRSCHHQASPMRPGPVWATITELNGAR